MKVKIKICGIRTLEAAQTAINAGADFLGFNFVESSKRYIKPEFAKQIIKIIDKQIRTVGVFQNAKTKYIDKIAKQLDLDFVQLHEKQIIKSTKSDLTYLLVDRITQGTGKIPNLYRAKDLARKSKIFFAGGLTLKNVSTIIKKVEPFAVDVAGGIETNEIQDNEKIKNFINKVKEINI